MSQGSTGVLELSETAVLKLLHPMFQGSTGVLEQSDTLLKSSHPMFQGRTTTDVLKQSDTVLELAHPLMGLPGNAGKSSSEADVGQTYISTAIAPIRK